MQKGVVGKLSLVWVALLLLAVLAVTPIVAQEVGSGGIGGRPAYPREDNPRSKSIFIHTLEPGQSVQDGVTIINNSNNERTVLVYPTDSSVSSGGAFACEQLVDEADEVGSWITLEKDSVTLASAGTETINFTITVPEDVDVGEHNGCIVMQGATDNEQETTQGIGLNFRSAIRVAILVPGEIQKELRIANFTDAITREKVTLTANVENLGNVSVDADIQATLNTLWDSEVSKTGGVFPVLRNETGEWNFDHEKPFWGGWYKANLTVEYDQNVDNFIGEDVEPDKVMLTTNTLTLFIFPQLIALAIYVVSLALFIWTVWSIIVKLKQRKDIKKNWITYTVKPGVNIKRIAKARNISWKKLARANKIKAPYTLEPGSTIKIPPAKKK